MNILFYRYGSICEPDIIQSLKELGNNIDEITVEIYNKDFTPSEGVRLLTDTLFAHSYDFVFSINFLSIYFRGMQYLPFTIYLLDCGQSDCRVIFVCDL